MDTVLEIKVKRVVGYLTKGFECVNCDILLKNLTFVEFITEWDSCLNYTLMTKNGLYIKSPNSNETPTQTGHCKISSS